MATKITDFADTARLWQTIGPIAANGDVTGDAIDMIEGDGPAFAILSVGSDVGEASVNGNVQTSDDAETWNDIPDAVFASQGGSGARAITFQRPKRYVRVMLTVSGADDPITLAMLLGQSRKLM